MKSFRTMFRSIALITVLCLATLGTTPASGQALFPSNEAVRRSRDVHVAHYALDVRFDLSRKEVIGKTVITFTPLRDRLDSVVFDAADLNVTGVTATNGRSLRFNNRSPFLAVHLESPRHWGDTVSVVVEYSCIPKKGLYFIEPDSAHPQRHHEIWTQGEDTDNHFWFPCYDYPNDKATSEVTATVPEEWTVLSNGSLERATLDARKHTRTFHWSQSKPHSSYLIVLVAGDFAILRDRVGTLPLTYYVQHEDSALALGVFHNTPAIMRFFEDKIGVSYPWEKFAQIVIDNFMYGGMENTSVVTLHANTIIDRRAALEGSSDDVIAHELAHQWWGDLITCRDWSHLWLNEGFATYFEQLYAGERLGADEFQHQRIGRSVEVRGTDRTFGRKPIVSPNSFTSNVYGRGAWALHMLRDVVGDEGFWRSLRLYISRNQYRNADTHELALAFEDATGRNLQWFFKQWLYGAGFPVLEVGKKWNDTTRSVALTVQQTQSLDSLTGIFQFPLHLQLTGTVWSIDTTVWVSHEVDTFRIQAPSAPVMVIADKGYHLLKEMSFPKDKEENIYQLLHASDIADRMTAAHDLRDDLDEPGTFAALIQAARRDPFWAVRTYALASLGAVVADSTRDAILPACYDADARVRAAAAHELEKFGNGPGVPVLERLATTDSSYDVIGAALRALTRIDSARAGKAALVLVDQPSLRNIVRQAAVRALVKSHDPQGLAVGLRYARLGNELPIREASLAILGSEGKESPDAKALLERSLCDDVADIRVSALRALKEWNTPEAKELLKARVGVEKDPMVKSKLDEALH